jgi:glutathione S-transferase
MPTLILHALPPSHPCMTAEAALRLKGLDYERIDFQPGAHIEDMQRIYGEGRKTVPGLLVDDEPVHGSRAILARLEDLEPEPSLYPSDEVRKAEEWGDVELQDLGRRIPWGALQFRPEALGTFGGGSELDPAGVDYAIRFVRGAWKYHGITAQRLADDLAGLPAKLDYAKSLIDAGVMGGDTPNAADLQIGATLRVLTNVGDVRPLLESRGLDAFAKRWFPDCVGNIPAGAFPRGWIPEQA